MNYYATLYAGSIIASLFCGVGILKKYKNPSGLFFFLFTISVSIWFLLYFLFFSGIVDPSTLLLLSRLDFGVGIISTSCLFFFVYFFDARVRPIRWKELIWIFAAYAIVLCLYLSDGLMIARLTYSASEGVYREIFGPFFPLHVVFHLGNVLGVVYYAYLQLQKQTYLSRVRFKHVLSAASLLILSGLILQLILPLFGIYILEQELILLYVFFTAYTFYVLRRYYFSSVWYGMGRILIWAISVILAILVANTIKVLYSYLWVNDHSYWLSRDGYSVVDITLWVVLFQGIYMVLAKSFLTNTYRAELKKSIRHLEQTVSHTTDVRSMDIVFAREVKKIFKTRFAEIRLFDGSNAYSEMRRYFENNLSDKIFIRDIVFMEEKKTKFDQEKLLGEIPDESFLILPLFSADGKNIGIVLLGAKPFGDFYTTEEIDILRDLTGFLELHLKYIGIYGQIRDLSVNLDKKVDEKTMEYNNLLNKQKEFISLISHEVKSPIANAVFQADSILDDLEWEHPSISMAKADLQLLNAQLQDTGELLSKLFSVQYYDTHDVTLFREKVRISYLLTTEYEVYSRMHEDIHFINEIDPNMGFVEIDRIQFQQVLSNILGNAVKFRQGPDPTIRIRSSRDDQSLSVMIEDNGKWFQGIDISELFTRYSRWGGGSIGLGMWLYLCKRIIDMHHGEITASHSESLWGARFDMRLPVH